MFLKLLMDFRDNKIAQVLLQLRNRYKDTKLPGLVQNLVSKRFLSKSLLDNNTY